MNQNSNGGNSAPSLKNCTHCDKQVLGGKYIDQVFYCPMCASIINKNNQTTDSIPHSRIDVDKTIPVIQELGKSIAMIKAIMDRHSSFTDSDSCDSDCCDLCNCNHSDSDSYSEPKSGSNSHFGYRSNKHILTPMTLQELLKILSEDD